MIPALCNLESDFFTTFATLLIDFRTWILFASALGDVDAIPNVISLFISGVCDLPIAEASFKDKINLRDHKLSVRAV